MTIKYGDAKKILAQYAGRGGKCPDTEEVDLFCKQVFQYMLYSGQHGNLRKFCFNAINGCFTAPYELETPLKVKVEGLVGSVWNYWYDFANYGDLGTDCLEAATALHEEPNRFCTVYDLPSSYCRVGVLGTTTEADDASIIVSGLDSSGREIVTTHKGEQIKGEYLRVRKGELRYSQVKFAAITGITKSRTNGYVQLLWVRPELGTRGFLSDYSPFEETPQYRRFKLTSPCSSCVKVAVLGRIRLKEHYADSEIIPFENLYALQLAGQAQNAQYNNDPAMAQAKDTVMQDVIQRENEYKKSQAGTPIEVYHPLSAGTIRNIV